MVPHLRNQSFQQRLLCTEICCTRPRTRVVAHCRLITSWGEAPTSQRMGLTSGVLTISSQLMSGLVGSLADSTAHARPWPKDSGAVAEKLVFPACLLRWVDSCQDQAQDTCQPSLSPPSLLPSAYHGHLSSLIDISPYKFRNLDGQKEWVHVVCTAQGATGRCHPQPG